MPYSSAVQMVPSGSGKTTLLDVLAGRKTQGEISGDILLSAQTPSINFLRRFTGYVEQFDTLVDILTVREMLLYIAEIKHPVDEPLSTKEAIVDKYIDVLGLEVCKDTKIGNSLNRCCSGEGWPSVAIPIWASLCCLIFRRTYTTQGSGDHSLAYTGMDEARALDFCETLAHTCAGRVLCPLMHCSINFPPPPCACASLASRLTFGVRLCHHHLVMCTLFHTVSFQAADRAVSPSTSGGRVCL